MRNVADFTSFLVILVAFAFMVAYAYFSFYPFQVLRFEQLNADGTGYYDVITKQVRAGGLLQYEARFEKLMDLNSTVSCFFLDGIIYKEPSFITDNPMGLNNTIRAKQVPSTLPPGIYRYSCEIFYDLTMHRTLRYQFYTDYFEVVE